MLQYFCKANKNHFNFRIKVYGTWNEALIEIENKILEISLLL